jgi:hypothetical protein
MTMEVCEKVEGTLNEARDPRESCNHVLLMWTDFLGFVMLS